MAAKNTVKVTFEFERETKGAVRFQEVKADPDKEPVVGTLYVRKQRLNGATPKKCTANFEFE